MRCRDCESPIKQAEEVRCSLCFKAALATGAELTISHRKCGDCGVALIGIAHCDSCHSRGVNAAKSCSIGRYPHVGLPPTDDVNDQVLSFLTILTETCACTNSTRRCVRCQDAVRIRGAFSLHLGEVRA